MCSIKCMKLAFNELKCNFTQIIYMFCILKMILYVVVAIGDFYPNLLFYFCSYC